VILRRTALGRIVSVPLVAVVLIPEPAARAPVAGFALQVVALNLVAALPYGVIVKHEDVARQLDASLRRADRAAQEIRRHEAFALRAAREGEAHGD
jgi:hypothetical protein